jgi:hypothetical protein
MTAPESAFPVKRYAPWLALTGVGGLGRVAMYVAEQAASHMPFWAQLPWTAIAVFAMGALLGTIYADWANADSELRRWWRAKGAFASFGQVYYKHSRQDFGEHHGGRLQCASVALPVQFHKRVRLDAIRVTGYVYSFRDNFPISRDSAWAMHVWKQDVGKQYLEGDTFDVNVAQIPFERGHPGCYKEAGSSGRYLSDSTAHIVIVELIAGSSLQSKKILILLPSKSVSSDGKTVTTGGRFVVIEDRDSIFPDLPVDNSKLSTVDRA